MSTNFSYKDSTTFARMSLPPPSAGTFHADRIMLDKVAVVAEADFIVRDTHRRYLRAVATPEIGDNYTDEEEAYVRAYHALVPTGTVEEDEAAEREWHSIINQSHVQQGLLHLVEGIRRQIEAGETEEGGFAVE